MLASILFFLLVYLGMKYHWGDTIKKLDSTQQIELKLPEMKMPPFNSTTPRIMDDGLGDATVFSKETKKFQPAIINNPPALSMVDGMTKEQITLQCRKLYHQSLGISNDPNSALLIGNCVVNNYQEPFQNNSVRTAKMIEKNKHVKLRAINLCRQRIIHTQNNGFSGIEKQLLVGICVSNQISQ